jgi:SSS family solute:Na+ symporter
MNILTPLLAAADAPAASHAILTAPDWAAIVAYFGVLLCVAWWVIKRRKDTAEDYFLAGRNLSWWVIGASIFASNIGSEHIVGLAGSGAKTGVALAHYELHAWCLLVLAWVFVPFYARSMVFTMPEFLERRFSPGSRYVLSVVSMITFVVTKIAVGIYAGGVVFSTLLPEMHVNLGWGDIGPFWIGSVLVVVLTGLYTMLGGMRAVAYNDAVQVIVLIGGSATLTFYGLHQLGGWGELRRLCGSDMFNLWKPLIPAGVQSSWSPILEKNAAGDVVKEAWYFNQNFPWLGMAICAPVIGLWYWCTDQYIVQRALGAPNQQTARRGSIFAAFLKLFPVYLFIIPGLICFALAKKGVAPGLEQVYDPATGHAAAAASQGAFPLMVAHLLPPGLRGIVVAGLLSALMGSLAGVFNACSTLFTVDIYEKLRPGKAQHEIVRVGRIATATMVIMAILWIPVVKGRGSLYEYLQSVQGYLAPPVFVVFFFGVFWKRLNAKGCFWSMVVGFVIGLARMIIDTPVAMTNGDAKPFLYTPNSLLWIINNINFQYFSVLITIVCIVVMVVVSYMTAAPDDAKLAGLTFATASEENKSQTRASWGFGEVAASVFVLLCILGAYLYFTG